MLLFTRDEYAARLRRVLAAMEARGLDSLVIASPANQCWLTGFDAWSFYTPQVVVVSPKLAEPLWIGRAMDAAGAHFNCWLAADNVIAYPDRYVGSDTLHPLAFVAEELSRRGLAEGTVGVEMDDYYYTARWHHELTSGLPNARFADAFLLVNRCRMAKSPAELAFMRQAGAIAVAAQEAAFEAAAPGVRQCDVMAEVYKVTTAGTAEFGGTFPCKPPNAMVNERASAPHLSWTDEPLAPGDLFYIELGGVRHRYHVPLSRIVLLREASDEERRVAGMIAEGLAAVLAAVKPGARLCDLAAAWKRVTEPYGVHKEGRLGYPVGVGFPPTWGELTASIRAGDETVLEPGMTFHVIPAIWLRDRGIVISETFAVTEAGAECFCDYPRKIFEKI